MPKFGFKHSEKTKQKMMGRIPWNKGMRGIHLSPKTEFKVGQTVDNKNSKWRGSKVKYRALHDYLQRKYGTPCFCELCGTTEMRKYHWAKKFKKYSRERQDWMRVCVPCHKNYDLGKIILCDIVQSTL